MRSYIAKDNTDHKKYVFTPTGIKVCVVPDWLFELHSKDDSINDLIRYLEIICRVSSNQGETRGYKRFQQNVKDLLGLEEKE